MRGSVIVIEGLDGSGKATQAARLADWLKEQGQQVLPVTFPDYESPSSMPVRMYLAGEMGAVDEVSAYAASSFYAVDRYVSFQNNWKKQYEAGYTIVADRYTTSNAAHQMTKLPVEEWNSYLRWMEDYEYGRLELPMPDKVIYLDMEPSISQTLLETRDSGRGALDIHEANLDYLQSCRYAALYAAGRMHWEIIRCDDGVSPLSVDEVFARIIAVINNK